MKDQREENSSQLPTQLKQLQKESMKKIQAEFFSGFLSQLLKLHTNCEDLSSI